MQILVRKVMPPWRQQTEGSNPNGSKGFYLMECQFKWAWTKILMLNFYVLKVLGVYWINCLVCIRGRCAPNSNKSYKRYHLPATFCLFLFDRAMTFGLVARDLLTLARVQCRPRISLFRFQTILCLFAIVSLQVAQLGNHFSWFTALLEMHLTEGPN